MNLKKIMSFYTFYCYCSRHSLFIKQHILGQIEERPSVLDKDLAKELIDCADEKQDGFQTILGKTMCTTDFYEGIFFSPSGQIFILCEH